MAARRGKVVGFVPARGGSKSIPLKNIRLLAGRPLIYWVLDALTECALVDEVYVGTDDALIAQAVKQYGRGVRLSRRKPETATDEASTESALLDFASQVTFDHVCLVQATSPLLQAEDLEHALTRYFEGRYDSLLSVVAQKRFLWTREESGIGRPINYDPQIRPRRQEMEGLLVENGAFYISRKDGLMASGTRVSGRIGLYEMPEETYVELDEPHDWPIVEQLLLSRRQGELSDRLNGIHVLGMDVDGVLTDAGMYYGAEGEELKKFNTRDGKGIERVKNAGIVPVIITSENTSIVTARARKLGIEHVYIGVKNKRATMERVCEALGITMEAVAFIGDDVNDAELLRNAGFSAAPADAQPQVMEIVDYVCATRGGQGCVREVCELLLGTGARTWFSQGGGLGD